MNQDVHPIETGARYCQEFAGIFSNYDLRWGAKFEISGVL
jgi:hypothetical protein